MDYILRVQFSDGREATFLGERELDCLDQMEEVQNGRTVEAAWVYKYYRTMRVK